MALCMYDTYACMLTLYMEITHSLYSLYSLAALELADWKKQHLNKKSNNRNKNINVNNIENNNSNNDIGNDDDNINQNNSNRDSNYNLFRIASKQLESTYSVSLDIQERYGINS